VGGQEKFQKPKKKRNWVRGGWTLRAEKGQSKKSEPGMAQG
jgi:hypothetical protein